jgi:hypothetical protein
MRSEQRVHAYKSYIKGHKQQIIPSYFKGSFGCLKIFIATGNILFLNIVSDTLAILADPWRH